MRRVLALGLWRADIFLTTNMSSYFDDSIPGWAAHMQSLSELTDYFTGSADLMRATAFVISFRSVK